MNKTQQSRYESLYQQHVNALRRQGKSKNTVNAYARALRRVTEHFDRCPDRLTVADLKEHFGNLVNSHSWSTVKVDRNGLQFFYKQVLDKKWLWVDIPHTRRLDYHPHVHLVVPGGCLNPRRRQWKTLRGKYLFNAQALARVFRARLLAAIQAAGLEVPKAVPSRWVVHCTHAGKGLPALKYLSRYLYRGVKLAWQRGGLTPGSDRFICYRVGGRPSTIPGSFNNAIMLRLRATYLYLLALCIMLVLP